VLVKTHLPLEVTSTLSPKPIYNWTAATAIPISR